MLCYNALSGEVIGYIIVPEDASWGYVATRVGLRMPDYQAVPSVNAFNIRARDMESISLRKRQPGEYWC